MADQIPSVALDLPGRFAPVRVMGNSAVGAKHTTSDAECWYIAYSGQDGIMGISCNASEALRLRNEHVTKDPGMLNTWPGNGNPQLLLEHPGGQVCVGLSVLKPPYFELGSFLAIYSRALVFGEKSGKSSVLEIDGIGPRVVETSLLTPYLENNVTFQYGKDSVSIFISAMLPSEDAANSDSLYRNVDQSLLTPHIAVIELVYQSRKLRLMQLVPLEELQSREMVSALLHVPAVDGETESKRDCGLYLATTTGAIKLLQLGSQREIVGPSQVVYQRGSEDKTGAYIVSLMALREPGIMVASTSTGQLLLLQHKNLSNVTLRCAISVSVDLASVVCTEENMASIIIYH